nr:hypothetical protein [Tanacetum cinerariifolium]
NPTGITSSYFKSRPLVVTVCYTCCHLAALRIYYAKAIQLHLISNLVRWLSQSVTRVAILLLYAFTMLRVGLLKITEGHTVPLSPPATTTSEDSGDIIDKSFDDADQEHVVENSDDVLEELLLIM